MKTIGLICEGVSEFNVMETILSRYLGAEYIVNPIQPEVVIENGVRKQSSGGGWSRVLAHCNETKFSEILQLNDYLVVQIDADACQQYGVEILDSSNRNKPDELLYSEIVARLCAKLSEHFLDEFGSRIVFAVCFNEIECWLLPVYISSKKERCRTHNCIYTLNRELARKNLPVIPCGDDKNSSNALKAYRKILRCIKNKKNVEDISSFNYGFLQLVSQLSTL